MGKEARGHGRMYGYVRVSTRDQNEDRQVFAMRGFGVPDDGIVVEKMSGKDFNRPAYQRLLKKLRPGDIFVVKSIDRLGRDYDEIIEQWRFITKEREAAIVVIDMPLLDTRQKDRDLTASFIADIVLQILSYVAQQEREFILQRQAEGIAAARARGVKLGRPPTERPELLGSLRELWMRGEITSRAAGRQLGVSHVTFLTWITQQ